MKSVSLRVPASRTLRSIAAACREHRTITGARIMGRAPLRKRKSLDRAFRLALLATLLAAAPARADDAPKTCDVPDSLLATDSSLPKVEDAVRNGHALDILVVGSRSSTIPSDEGAAYPARLEAALRERLPASVVVNVSVELQVKKSAEDVAKDLGALLEQRKPALVVWQTGTVDAMRSVDPDGFRVAVDDGVVAMQKAGADVVLMNLQYSPRTETMIAVPPYLDNLRAVAQARDVPLFDRFGIMRQWNDNGDFDLFDSSHGLDLARRVHDCIGRALSQFLIAAAHLGPQQQN